MNAMPTILAIGVATLSALAMGPLLGRLATQWFSGRGFNNALMELRGVFLPFLLAPAVGEATGWPAWLTIGSVVGFGQTVAFSRWVGGRAGQWSPALVGALALGRSRAALLSARTRARGAIVAQLASTCAQVIFLEAVLTALKLPSCNPENSMGAHLVNGAGASLLAVFGVGTALMLTTEVLTSRLLQRRNRSQVRTSESSRAAPGN